MKRSCLSLAIAALVAGGCGGDLPPGAAGEPTGSVAQAARRPPPAYRPLRGDRRARLAGVQLWMYQIQDLDRRRSIRKLAASPYQLLVLEPGLDEDYGPWPTAAWLKKLRARRPGRLILAYVDIGQAERWRDYWRRSWRAPTRKRRGSPSFMVAPDPDGWADNYPVAYWDAAWKAIWLGRDGIVARLARVGFDGVYLDWVEAYDDDRVIKAARAAGRAPAREMIRFVEELGAAGRAVTADFLVVAQNAPFLIDADPARYAAAIDALAVEDTWFNGRADAGWRSRGAGDLHNRHRGRWSTAGRLAQYRKYRARGLRVFSVDYCRRRRNARKVYTAARKAGLVPLVSRVSLSRVSVTPPWQF